MADYGGNKIRRVTTAGVVNTIAGTGTAGNANGAGNAATFTNPTDVAIDSMGNIYVSEAGSNLIRKIVYAGSNPAASANYTVSTFAGSGSAGLLDGNGTAAAFDKPYGLATDPNGNVYVADYQNNVIRMIDPSANVTTIAGTDVASDLDGYGNAATFDRPFGVAYENGALFVSENAGSVVREVMPVPGAGITSSGWLVETLAGTAGDEGASVNGAGNAAVFNSLHYIAASPSSSLYVADYSNNLVRRINPSTGTFPIGMPTGASTNTTDQVQLSNSNGVVDGSDLGPSPYITYNVALGPGQTSQPQPWNFTIPPGVTSFQFQVIVESSTSILVPLQAQVGAGSPLVDVRPFLGTYEETGFVDGTASSARIGNLVYLAIDGAGNLYGTDSQNDRIFRVDPNGNLNTIAGTLNTGNGFTNGPGTTAAFAGPTQLTVNPAGTEIFVCDYNNHAIRRIALTGSDPTNAADWTVTTIAGNGDPGSTNGAGSSATFTYPFGITMSGGVLYVAEQSGGRIRSLSFVGGDRSLSSSWNVQFVAGSSSGTYGNANGTGGSVLFRSPSGLASDAYGNIYIADAGNNEIRKMDAGGHVTTFAGSGSPAYTDALGASAAFNDPFYLTIDSAGYLYVADRGNDVIRRISPSGNVETVAGIYNDSGFVNGPGSTAQIYAPTSVCMSTSGQLYVASITDVIREIQTVFSSSATSARPK